MAQAWNPCQPDEAWPMRSVLKKASDNYLVTIDIV